MAKTKVHRYEVVMRPSREAADRNVSDAEKRVAALEREAAQMEGIEAAGAAVAVARARLEVEQLQQIAAFAQTHPDTAGIIYCMATGPKDAESTARAVNPEYHEVVSVKKV